VNTDSKRKLIEYGRALMARAASVETTSDIAWAAAFLKLLNPKPTPDAANAPLRCIFDLVQGGKPGAAAQWMRPVPLALGRDGDPAAWPLMPVSAPPDAAARRTLYADFERRSKEIGQDTERFFHLMRRFATLLPNTYGEPGVSLFEQWKMVAALVQISGGTGKVPARLGLVGGDIPGIQRTINTITSKGAAKAMRGRSAFIQLLGHALVERLLDALELDVANVVYDAGGNFVLLTGWTEGDHGTRAAVQTVANQVNAVLLAGAGKGAERFDGFHGDLAAALAAVEIPVAALAVPQSGAGASAWQQAEKTVKDAVAAAKSRPFGDLAQASPDGWAKLFKPDPAETADFCAVCRRPRGKDERFESLTDEGEGQICRECKGFNELADKLGHIGDESPRLALSFKAPRTPKAWQCALHAVAERWYIFGDERQTGDIVLALDMDDFPAAGVDGLRLLAHTTPMTGNQIKTNEELADASCGGLKRLGVLRMDVDNLGDLVVHGLPRRTAMQTAELSQALERFFAGWLDRICARVDKGEDLFYVLFAGGDDLFVVGPWTHMPGLAQAVRDDFARYTGNHPDIHLSAGIAVVGEKAPMYAAADESHEALGDAKKLERDTAQAKNAITFLGYTTHWAQFGQATKLKDDIVTLAEKDGLGNAVITRLLAIARRYQRDRQRGPYAVKGKTPQYNPEAVYFGPWMWRQAYTLARVREGCTADVAARLQQLEKALLGGQIINLGLAARWAQWLTRKEPEDGNANQQ
jgi:CRISPR-associated protein Csm1